MKSQFILIKQGKEKAAKPVIYLQVFDSRFKDRKFLYSTTKHIDLKLWDPEDQKARIKRTSTPEENKNLHALNVHLKSLKDRVDAFEAIKLNSSTLDKEELKEFLQAQKTDDRKQAEDEVRKGSDFFKVWQEIIDTTRVDGKLITGGTKLSKQQTLNKLTAFAMDNHFKPTFENIDKDFYTKFTAYLEAAGLNPNSVGKHIKEIKAVLREADDRGIKVNPSYLKKSFRVYREPAPSTYLTMDEIKKLMVADVKGKKAEHRDVFVMACFVGARHSDWHQIHPDNVEVHDGMEMLGIKQKKTGDTIFVPIHPVVKMIWKKYKDNPPTIIARNKIAEAIREICKDPEKVKLGNVKINGDTVEKWTTISTHTARRSFATNSYLSGMDVHQIMRCTGHKTEASFLNYLKLDGKDYARKASESKFFAPDSSWLDLGPKLKIA